MLHDLSDAFEDRSSCFHDLDWLFARSLNHALAFWTLQDFEGPFVLGELLHVLVIEASAEHLFGRVDEGGLEFCLLSEEGVAFFVEAEPRGRRSLTVLVSESLRSPGPSVVRAHAIERAKINSDYRLRAFVYFPIVLLLFRYLAGTVARGRI